VDPVGIDPGHDEISGVISPWRQQSARAPNQMYVLPAGTVPAVVSSHPIPAGMQTAVVMNSARGGIVSEMTQMHTGNMGNVSTNNYASAGGGNEKEVPVAYAEALQL